MKAYSDKVYRQNVAGVIINDKGKVLLAERIDEKGHWQFPQGGVDKEENLEQALKREIEEELGIKPEELKILAQAGNIYRYDWPEKLRQKRFCYYGQEQHFFLLLYLGDSNSIKVSEEEFQNYDWVDSEKVLEVISPVRKKIATQVLDEFKEYL